jgi:hypothetical protein
MIFGEKKVILYFKQLLFETKICNIKFLFLEDQTHSISWLKKIGGLKFPI